MRVLLMAPGPTHSTFDIFTYYLKTMRDNTDIIVKPFNYHNITLWQLNAIKYYKPDIDAITAAEMATSRAAREFLTDVITFRPDVVFIISGLAVPVGIIKVLNDMRQNLIRKFAIAFYFTECPYQNIEHDSYVPYADILFINDKYSLEHFDPKRNLEVYYLPHSYYPKVHRSLNEGDNYDRETYKSDVFFAATPFRERCEFLAKVDWGDINFKLGGNWAEVSRPEDYLKLHKHVFAEGIIDNDIMARYYANAKTAINIHRRSADLEGFMPVIDNSNDAYSVGPRVFEAVACGAALLTDFRQEAVDIFGDSISYFDTPKDLQDRITFLLEHEEIRQNMIRESQNKIQNCTFEHRLNNIVLPVFDKITQTYLRHT